MTRKEYNRKYAYLGDKKHEFATATYKTDPRYWDRVHMTTDIDDLVPSESVKPQPMATIFTTWLIIEALYHLFF